MSAIHEAAVDYRDRLGWQLVIVKERLKRAAETKWQDKKPEPENFGATYNIGIKLGPKSGNLVDIDLDWPEARRMAELPELFGGIVSFGREGHPHPGHRLLVCPDLLSEDAKLYKCAPKATEKANEGKICVMEVRAGGGYTVFPPSEHDAKIIWCAGKAPAAIPQMAWAEIRRRAKLCAFLAVALRHYPEEGGRDDYIMHIGGTLAHWKIDAELGDALIHGLCEAAGDTSELSMRVGKCQQAWQRVEAGEETTGLQTLRDGDYFTEDEFKSIQRFMKPRAKSDKVSTDSVDVSDPDLGNFFKVLQARIIEANPYLVFRRAGDLVHVRILESDETMRDKKVVVKAGSTEIATASEGWLSLAASLAGVKFHRINSEGKQRICRPDGLKVLLSAPEETRFLRLAGVSTTPTMERNEPGYDPKTNMMLVFPEGYFPEASMSPTKEEAEAALARLKWPLREFPFEGAGSRSVMLSAMLSGVIRGEMKTCPLHAFDAPEAGTGKSKLAEIVSIVVTGVSTNIITYTRDPVEMEKRLDSILARGGRLVNIDNVDSILGDKALEQMLTATSKSARVLGESRTITLDTRLLLMASGNNLEARRDMVRRMVKCRLDSKVENPDLREFNFDPVAEVTAARAQLVVDCLTILRAYKAAGEPDSPRPLGSFEDWTIVRGALMWLSEDDPTVTQSEGRASDPDREARAEVLEALWNQFGGEQFLAKRLDEQDDRADAVRIVITRSLRKGVWSSMSAAKLFRRYKDKVTGAYTMRSEHDPVAHAQAYWIERKAVNDPGETQAPLPGFS